MLGVGQLVGRHDNWAYEKTIAQCICLEPLRSAWVEASGEAVEDMAPGRS